MTQADKIQWLYDVEQIKQLKHQYCAYCDQQYDPNGLAGLFTSDAIWDGGLFGRAEGREKIRAFFTAASARAQFANHYVTNPIIEVDGDKATGRWDLWQPMVRAMPEPEALWLIGKYSEEYARSDDVWRIKNLQLEVKALSPYAQGFAEKRFIDA